MIATNNQHEALSHWPQIISTIGWAVPLIRAHTGLQNNNMAHWPEAILNLTEKHSVRIPRDGKR